MSRKRRMAAAVLALLLAFGMTGCGGREEASNAGEDGRLKIVCTIFPEYDWVREILGASSFTDSSKTSIRFRVICPGFSVCASAASIQKSDSPPT